MGEKTVKMKGGKKSLRVIGANDSVDLKDVMEAMDKGMSVSGFVSASKAANESGTSLAALMREANTPERGGIFRAVNGTIKANGTKSNLADVVNLVNSAKEEGIDIKKVGSMLGAAARQGVSAGDLVMLKDKAKEEGMSFKSLMRKCYRDWETIGRAHV